MTKGIEIDVETRSPVDLKTHGAFVYFENPLTEVLMASYRINEGPMGRWRRGQPCPADLAQAIVDGATISAHNAQFETLALHLLHERQGWPAARPEQFRCTAATAAAMSLPRDLAGLGAALGLETQKDKEGTRLIRLFSIPRRAKKDEPPGLYWNEPSDFPEDFEKFHDYCDRDVLTEAEADRRMIELSADEQSVWWLDQKINQRGVRIDRTSALAAIRLADKSKKLLDREMRAATGGYVAACSQPGKLVEWVQMQGVELVSAAKAEITDLLDADDLPDHVRAALLIRQEAAKTSVSKLQAMLNRASADGRVRGSFLYHGASTGRWSSTGANLANMPRPRREFDEAKPRLDVLFEAFRTEDPNALKYLYGDTLGRPLHLISDAIRGFIWAGPGKELVQADYSGIEGAVIAWMAGEDWKVAAMHDIIADPALPDMYRRTAAGILNLTTDVVTKKHWARQAVGKVSELACFSSDTKVLTSNGVMAIVEVSENDLLWDGEEWVTHKGVISKGARPVVVVDGIGVTPDHLIRTAETWTAASQLASDQNLLDLALATGSANLKSSGFMTDPVAGCAALSCAARAGASRTKSRLPIFAKARPRVAPSALNSQRTKRAKTTSATTTWCQTTRIGGDCLTASRRASIAALTQTIKATLTMGGAALRFFGGATGARSLNTSSRWTDGTLRGSNLTAPMSTEIMLRVTFALLRGWLTRETAERRKTCNTKSQALKQNSPTCVPVFDILEAGSRNRFTIFSDSGALIVHNCGFGGGVSAFYSMAKNYNVNLHSLYQPIWDKADDERREKALKRYASNLARGKAHTDVLSKEAWVASEIIKVGWRATNPAIAKSWRDLEAAVRDAVENPGTVTSASKTSYVVRHGFLWARLPSGRCLAYGSPRLSSQVWAEIKLPDGSWSDAEVLSRAQAEFMELKGEARIQGDTSPAISVMGVNSTTKKWTRSKLYGGLLAENCLGAETEVLTPYGWKRIVDIQPTDKLWDGLRWVSHDGLVYQGDRETIELSGVRLTPDHNVWTDHGWKAASRASVHEVTTASPHPGFYRAGVRSVDGAGLCGRGREEKLVAEQVLLRHGEVVHRFGTSQGENPKLRVFGVGNGGRQATNARHVGAQSLRGVAQYAGSLFASVAQSVCALWWARDNGLLAVAEVFGLLGRPRADLARGSDDRAAEQQRRVFAGELRLAGQESAGAEQAKQQNDQHTARSDARGGSLRGFGYRCDDATVSDRGGLANVTSIPAAGLHEPRIEPVFDLLNAGPLHRFTVRAAGGAPFIVSNCTQAVARDLLVNGMWKAEAAGYPIIAHVYDEIICEVPRGFGDLAEFERLICELPAWAEGMPLTAGGWRGKRYRKD